MAEPTDKPDEPEVIEEVQPEPEAPEPEKEPKEEVQPEEAQPEPEKEPEPSQPVEEAPEEEPQSEPSRREQKRVRDLLQKYPDLNQPQKPQGINYREMINADDEVYQKLEQESQQYGQSRYQEGLNQARAIEFRTRLEIDAPRVESKYPQLDKTSPNFDPDLADDLNTLYLHVVGYDQQSGVASNPNIRYSDFIDTQIGVAERLASKKNAETTANVAKQAASAGLRPTGPSEKGMNLNKAPEDMSDDELKAAISATMPRDAKGRFVSQN